MHELMQDQLTVLPAVRPDDDPVADGHAATSTRYDLGALSCVSELFVVGQRDAIDHEYSDPGRILHADTPGIGDLARGEWCAVFEDKGLLRLRPLAGERRQAVEFFLINHGARER